LRASRELTWQRTAEQAGKGSSSAMRSVLQSMLGSVIEKSLGGVLGRVFGVYLGASCEPTSERIVKQAGSVTSSAIRSVLCEHARECT